MPKRSHNKIRSVRIHYFDYIRGFAFFDKEGALLWEIGDTRFKYGVKTVLIGENEVIVGVVAKLYSGNQSRYTDFSF